MMSVRLPIDASTALGLRLDLGELAGTEWALGLDFVSLDDYIHAVCLAVLGQPPTPTQRDDLKAKAARRDGRIALLTDLLNSEEFRCQYSRSALARMPLEAYIRQVYRDVLGRSPDAGGMQTYLRMGGKWRGRKRVLKAIAGSPEGIQSQGGRLGQIRLLQRQVRLARLARIPLLGALFAVREQRYRLMRLELLAIAQWSPAAHVSLGSELMRQIAACRPTSVPDVAEPDLHELAAGATDAERADWVFQDQLRRARRREAGVFAP